MKITHGCCAYTWGIGVLVGYSLFANDFNLGTLVMNYYHFTLFWYWQRWLTRESHQF